MNVAFIFGEYQRLFFWNLEGSKVCVPAHIYTWFSPRLVDESIAFLALGRVLTKLTHLHCMRTGRMVCDQHISKKPLWGTHPMI